VAIVLDRSNSMGDSADGFFLNASQRWIPVRDGLLDFLDSPGTKLQASLHLFPSSADGLTACQTDYAVPDVAMTSLPARSTFARVLDVTVTQGGTPTASALFGARKSLKAGTRADDSVPAAIILITDGEPSVYDTTTMKPIVDCAPAGVPLKNTIEDVASLAKASYDTCPSIPTYVIGVGSDIPTMPIIAASGGTTFSSLSSTDPALTRSQLAELLREIASRL
jgi:hypothetical protein